MTAKFRGFTLVELLIVIAIIAILAGLILSTSGYIQKRSARARTEAEIAAMAAALESYKADNGDYPVGAAGDPSNTAIPTGNIFLYSNLQPNTGKVYFEFTKSMLQASGATTNVVDAFGEGFGYYYQTNASNIPAGKMNGVGFYDLWSRGGGTTNTEQWIKNW
jgi:prepilin-type N-terminal cleavage/methylation domain-containing protein